MREIAAAIVVLAASAATGCISAVRCPTDRVCGNATWYTANNGTVLEGRLVVAPLTGVSGAANDGAESFTVGPSPVYLRFDVSRIAENFQIERAVLTLAPHPAWRTGGPTRITARGLASDWRATLASVIAVDPEPAGTVLLPGMRRMPVRIDVTAAVRAAHEGSSHFEGVALVADGSPVAFAGLGSDLTSMRPRLELVVR